MGNDEILIKKLDTIIALLATQGQDEDKKIFILKGLGHTSKEIGTLMDLPEGTVKSKIRAKRQKKGNKNAK